MILEKKLEKLAQEMLLSKKQKKDVWNKISQKTERNIFREFVDRVFSAGLFPKVVSTALIIVFLFSILPNYVIKSGQKMTIQNIFGTVYVVRAADYISVEDEMVLQVGDYVMVENPGRAVIKSRTGYEMVLESDSVIEVSPALSLETEKSVLFDDVALNLRQGTLIGSTRNFITSPIPILTSDKIVYSQNRSVFTITADDDENVVRSLSGVVTIETTDEEEISSKTNLLAGYKAAFNSTPKTNVIVLRDEVEDKKELEDDILEKKLTLSEEDSRLLAEKIKFLDVVYKQAIVDFTINKDSSDFDKWEEIYLRVGEIADLVGMNIEGEPSFSTVYDALSEPLVLNLTNFIETRYDLEENRDIQLANNLLGIIDNSMDLFRDSVVQSAEFNEMIAIEGFFELSLNMKMALILDELGNTSLDLGNKDYVNFLKYRVVLEEAQNIVSLKGESRIDALNKNIKVLANSEKYKDLYILFQEQFEETYKPLFK